MPTDKDGNPVIPDNAHVRLATAATNGGAQILRRGYSYNDGVNFTAERWPPWRQGMEYDAGLFFVCYQRDPRTGFIRIFDQVSKLDALNQFATHTGGGLFACPGGVQRGRVHRPAVVRDRLTSHAAGSTTVNRAPSTWPSGARRLSAMIRPRRASTIWRLIDRPRPECWPKRSSLGRSL